MDEENVLKFFAVRVYVSNSNPDFQEHCKATEEIWWCYIKLKKDSFGRRFSHGKSCADQSHLPQGS